MIVFDNVSKIVKDDLSFEIKRNSRVSIAAACFSIYAYKELKKQLEGVGELRFIFTSPAFTTEKAPKEKREFYIPRLSRERSLYGTEFEIKLRNELSQKAIAKECAEWIKRKVVFKSNTTNENMSGFINIEDDGNAITYMPFNGFTTVDIGCERGNNTYNMVTRIDAPHSNEFIRLFNTVWSDSTKLQDVTDVVIDNITAAYRENSPDYIYFVTLYNIFNEFLEDISEDVLPNEATGFKNSRIWNKLYNFQKDAALAIINKLEKYNGCILADSVGLGKTFTALAVIKYYENRNKTVLVLCPKKLSDNWNTFKDNYVNNPIAADRLNYDVLYHTDLTRERGESNGLNLSRLNWGNYDLVVIDESHNFRNGIGSHSNTVENRYVKLMEKVIRAGVRTKVLMLSATPVNNRFYDLRNQLQIAYEGKASMIDEQLDTKRSIDEIFRSAQRVFTAWRKQPPETRTTAALLRMLDFDFFEVLDSVTIARSRKHIQKYYNTAGIGSFPERLKPISERPCLTDLNDAINYNQIYELLMQLKYYTCKEHNRALADIVEIISTNLPWDLQELWVIDPYLTAQDLAYTALQCRVQGIQIRAICDYSAIHNNRITKDSSGATALNDYIKKQNLYLKTVLGTSTDIQLEFRTVLNGAGTAFHDRYIILKYRLNKERVWSLGASINSIGNKHSILQIVNVPEVILDHFEQLWEETNEQRCSIFNNMDLMKEGEKNANQFSKAHDQDGMTNASVNEANDE